MKSLLRCYYRQYTEEVSVGVVMGVGETGERDKEGKGIREAGCCTAK